MKQSLYFPEQMLREIVGEARRLDRSPSWVVHRAWIHARKVIAAGPSFPKGEEMPSTSGADAGGRAGE